MLLTLGLAMVAGGAGIAAGGKPTVRGAFVSAGDYADLQAAVDALPKAGGTVVLPPGTYDLRKTLDLTGKDGWRFISLIGQGYGHAAAIQVDTGDAPGIDLTGNAYCTFSGLRIVLRSCSVGVLMARKEGRGSAGNHVFRDVMIEGHQTRAHPGPSKALVASLGSEVNRYYNVRLLSNKPGITGLYVSAHNDLGLKSPYTKKTQGGCNTELRLYGSTIGMWGRDSYCLQLIGMCNDVSIRDCYLSAKGTAAIHMDGTRASVGNVTISNVRIEGEHARHILTGLGNIRHVTIDQGQWICGWGEPILIDASTKTFKDPVYYKADLRNTAHSWHIRDVFMSIWDGIDATRNMGTPHRYPAGDGGYVFMRFDGLVHSRIDNVATVAARFEKAPDGKTRVVYAKNKTAVAVARVARGNTFTRLSDGVRLPDDAVGNVVDRLEHGVRRMAIGAGKPGSVLNLAPQDPRAVAQPRAGDVVLDNTSGVLRLAVYDGGRWLFAPLTAIPAKPKPGSDVGRQP